MDQDKYLVLKGKGGGGWEIESLVLLGRKIKPLEGQ